MEILIAVAILGGLGLLFGLILAIASKVFYVETDPRLEKLNEALPGANCGGCGYAGCGAYAEAVLKGEAEIGKCASGGDEAAEKMGEIMGVRAEKVTRRVALVRCSGYKTVDGDGKAAGAKMKGVYEGIPDCLAATKVAGRGPLICKFGCLGFGNCTKACKYDAIHLVDGVAKVDQEKCVGCMQCAAACPRNLIIPVEYDRRVIIACASKAKGAVTIRGCTAGCIGCGLCVKICPHDAIHVEQNLAYIDYDKCDSCGLCATVCPKHLIADGKKVEQLAEELPEI
ncbi:MAG: RnfABCDGE type electron transport complex subunit B [Oscillospiraceae bacterium]|nr:RnfABCDGE type electron transport complex subunit B [Oscillospiraceae bacterium]